MVIHLYCDIHESENCGLIHSIFYGSNSFMLNRSHAYQGFIDSQNKTADSKKVKKFHKKIRAGFRDPELFPNHKIVLVEGDSWFEYPIFFKGHK